MNTADMNKQENIILRHKKYNSISFKKAPLSMSGPLQINRPEELLNFLKSPLTHPFEKQCTIYRINLQYLQANNLIQQKYKGVTVTVNKKLMNNSYPYN